MITIPVARPSRPRTPAKVAQDVPPVRRHLGRLSDDVGIAQHAVGAKPDLDHGYCTDDVARALIADILHAEPEGGQAVARSIPSSRLPGRGLRATSRALPQSPSSGRSMARGDRLRGQPWPRGRRAGRDRPANDRPFRPQAGQRHPRQGPARLPRPSPPPPLGICRPRMRRLDRRRLGINGNPTRSCSSSVSGWLPPSDGSRATIAPGYGRTTWSPMTTPCCLGR